MTPIYPNSSPFPPVETSIDDYEVHHQHLLFSSPSQASSSSSLTFPIFFNTTHDQGACFDREDDQQDVVNKYMLHGGTSSSDHQFFPSPSLPIVETDHDHETDYGGLKLSLSNQEVVEDHKDHHDDHHNPMEIGSSVKWMSSKMRLMRKMMNNPNRIVAGTSTPNKLFDQDHHHHHQQISSSLFNTDNSTNHFSKYNNNNNNNNNNNGNSTIRVCADCNTTKTPLWRSGPRGPKSLCNACGIRQRKARRAMAAAAAAAANNDTVLLATDGKEASSSMKTKGVHQKEIKIKIKKSSSSDQNGFNTQYKKRCKIVAPTDSSSSSSNREKLCFEDFTISLMSKNNSAFHQVFPQDEKEAAILLMALSCGLVHG